MTTTPAPATRSLPEIGYRLTLPAPGHHPGRHRSRRGESGQDLRGHALLIDAPDPRRIDLHASLRDPFGQWWVRRYAQRKAITVAMVVDVSASMGFAGRVRRLDVVADLAESLAWSAWRSGDRFGLVACDDAVQHGLSQPPVRAQGLATVLGERLRAWQPQAAGSHALPRAAESLGGSRGLVLLVSDFHLDEATLLATLASLAHHEVVPVVTWDEAEFGPLADPLAGDAPAPWGLMPLVDPETGRQRLVWWRPALRERWRAARTARRAWLDSLFAAQRLRPLHLTGRFDAEAVTRHFVT